MRWKGESAELGCFFSGGQLCGPGQPPTLLVPLSLGSDDHFCPDYWRMSRTHGKSLYQLQTTNGYEAVHRIRWGIQKKCTASRWGQTKCPSIPLEILAAQHVLRGWARLLQQTLGHESLEKLVPDRRPRPPPFPPATQEHSEPSAGHCARAERGRPGQSLRSKVFLRRFNYDISQALPWPNHALGTLDTGSVVTLGQKQPGWPLGRMWKKWSEAKSRVGCGEAQPL